EEDVKAMFEKTLREERRRREYHPRWIVLRMPLGSSFEAQAERKALAAEVVRRARGGEDFGALARPYSDDATRDSRGDLDTFAPQGSPQLQSGRRKAMAPDLDTAVQALEAGQITEPIRVIGPRGDSNLVIVQLVERQASRYTTYEASRNEMIQRLQSEILDKAKRKWLDELKSRTHLDVRL